WLIGKQQTGDAILSLSNVAQQAARDALGDRKGSVVVLDPATGEVVALWSYPAYDPGPLAAHSSKTVQAAYDGYRTDPANPMLARAYRERYPPGSTFKVVTASTAIDTGTATPQTRHVRAQQAELRQRRHRPGRRGRHPAADGHGGGHHRQRRRGHGPPRGAGDPRCGRAGHPQDRPRRVAPRRAAHHRRRRHPD